MPRHDTSSDEEGDAASAGRLDTPSPSPDGGNAAANADDEAERHSSKEERKREKKERKKEKKRLKKERKKDRKKEKRKREQTEAEVGQGIEKRPKQPESTGEAGKTAEPKKLSTKDFFAQLHASEGSKAPVGTVHAIGKQDDSESEDESSGNWECHKCGTVNFRHTSECHKCGALKRMSEYR